MKPTTASFTPPAVFALALSLTSPWALADANDTINIIPAVSWLYDGNIFRQSSDAAGMPSSSARLRIRSRRAR